MPEETSEKETTPLSTQEVNDASQANGTATADLVENLSENRFDQQKAQSKDYKEETKERRNKYIAQIYGNLNWDSNLTPLKILYKDLSTKLFLTIILCLVVLALAITKIYITRLSIDNTVKYSQLLADKNSLTLSNDNLYLEFLSLTSKSNIIRITKNKIYLVPISTEAEVIVVIPYLPQNKVIPTTTIPLLMTNE
ncbi:hypothetical protein CKF54_01460 [Psittacicella hinzii]|uniref:Cell division protein FtsL n=2 Tax=Psittacicella hinzii TaxID=2028575 RepID=A0A3A1YA98_9GAMM|nr:hypothetical protein CKF54_01460 [Psittacicella hinzii]